MMQTLEIMQRQPDDIKKAYEDYYHEEWSDKVFLELKTPLVASLTKVFYRNLAQTLRAGQLTQNDLCFLINLYESTIEYHLQTTNADYDQYTNPFWDWYLPLREEFFECIDNITFDEYLGYAADSGDNTINAGMNWLSEEKRDFLSWRFETLEKNYKMVK